MFYWPRLGLEFLFYLIVVCVPSFSAECVVVNDICCYVYNKHYVTDMIENTRKRVILIVKNDKIMCTKNSDVPTYSYNSSAQNINDNDDQDSEKEVQNEDNAHLSGSYETAEEVCEKVDDLYLRITCYFMWVFL